ncbi:hypothetical protein QQA44_05795 [Sneathia vaginalis]|uniref:hypothetical protein n=1 Tax=Sneathia vaginalis TaxID=187101 RepID=UPI002550B863|nr:hypothetical protein [Sneathia vaginalis]MDK9582327.1 hypothetical protein [Sneathia vaginalis]
MKIQKFVAKKTGVKTEVKVEGTGFSFGGDFKAEDLELSKADKKADFLDHSKVWAKYELPELKGVKSYVKATAEPKFIGTVTDKGSAELEGQVSYMYEGLTFGLQSKTNFPFVQKTANVNYGTDVKSTHKLFVESEEKKDVFVKGLKDVKANVEIKHDYRKLAENHKAAEAVDYVSGEVSAKYDAVKDLELEGKVTFKKNISAEEIDDYKVLETKLFEKGNARYIHSYELKGTYKGVKHLTLSAKPFVSHVHINDNKDQIMYGTELVTEYKMLNDKLTLTGKSLLAGNTGKTSFVTKENTKESVVVTKGYFVFDANAKYDYSVTDKFTVSPEANVNLSLFVHKGINGTVTEPTLTLTPKVSAEYKPTDTLTLKGSVETPVKFKVVGKEFKYTDTQVKTSLNLKYEWK